MSLTERLRGEQVGPPIFAPRVTRLAARLEQVNPESLGANPGALARTLRAAQSLLGLDTIVLDASAALVAACRSLATCKTDRWSSFDLSDVGRTPPWLLIVDAIARLRAETNGLVVVIPGPWALVKQVEPGATAGIEALEASGDACAGVGRTLAEARVGAVMLVEGPVPGPSTESVGLRLKTVCTLLRFYGVASIVCVPTAQHAAGPVGTVGADVIVIPAAQPFPAGAKASGWGLSLPTDWLLATPNPDYAGVSNAIAAVPGVRLVITEEDVPDSTPPEVFRHLSAAVRGRIS